MRRLVFRTVKMNDANLQMQSLHPEKLVILLDVVSRYYFHIYLVFELQI